MFSDQHKYSGTLDMLVELDGKKWLIDIKTSTSIHTSHYLQMSAYVKAYEEKYLQKVDHTGILWLKSSKKGPDKTKKRIQGSGWELKEGDKSIEEYFQMFLHTYETYKMMHPDQEIEMLTLPNSIKL
jgi:hypothetical protein